MNFKIFQKKIKNKNLKSGGINMAIETFNVSFTLSRDNSNDDDDTWVDEEHIANEIR